MKKQTEWKAICLAIFLLVTFVFFLGQLLIPPRTDYGSLWDSFRKEPRNSIDVLFFGSSLVYCSVIPACIWDECGVRSFVLAGPEQTMPMTYYYVCEACRTQSPGIIAVDCTGMFFKRYEHYTKANISYMPYGINRIKATINSAEKKEWAGLFMPILNYHQRWKDITLEDLRARIFPTISMSAGYTVLKEIYNSEYPAECEEYNLEYGDYVRNLEYLEKICHFCSDNNIQLLLYLTPTETKIPVKSRNELAKDLSALGYSLSDYNDSLAEMDINNSTDWYDNLHFNVRGAEKYSRWLSCQLYNMIEVSNTQDFSADLLWKNRLEYYYSSLNSSGE